MSTARRAYDLLRGYVSHEWERMSGPEDTQGREAFERELAQTLPPSPAAKPKIPEVVKEALTPGSARLILNVPGDASFGEIKRQYDRLMKRCHPDNFPSGTQESKQAAEIRTRVEAAYTVLRDSADATDRRFGTLEIE